MNKTSEEFKEMTDKIPEETKEKVRKELDAIDTLHDIRALLHTIANEPIAQGEPAESVQIGRLQVVDTIWAVIPLSDEDQKIVRQRAANYMALKDVGTVYDIEMECCYCDGIAKIQEEPLTLTYRGEEFTVDHLFYECSVCKLEFTTGEIDGISLKRVHDQYNEKHKKE